MLNDRMHSLQERIFNLMDNREILNPYEKDYVDDLCTVLQSIINDLLTQELDDTSMIHCSKSMDDIELKIASLEEMKAF